MDCLIVRRAMASWGRVFGGKKPAGSRAAVRSGDLPGELANAGATYPAAPRPSPLHLRRVRVAETGMNEDSSSALVEFASGAKGVYTQVFYARRDAATRGATVSGYLGTVSFDWYTNELKRVRHHAPFSDTVKGGQGLGHFGGDTALMENFLDVIHGRARSRTPIQMGIQSVYACLAARIAETGRRSPART